MCEWLSRSEWCDVHLLCGDRIFSAHRAVLASVSTFLRDLLLSCPSQEAPAFIVLPEFDIQTVSSVLDYIYKGEIMIEYSQMETFLEIVNTMQIFIDFKYLLKISKLLPNDNFHFDRYHTKYISNHDKPIFVCANDACKKFINIKKGTQFSKELSRVKCNTGDIGILHEKKDYYECENKVNESDARFLKSHLHSRQKEYFRDLFIKTYSPNGNSNGLAEGVLAIRNEHYHEPTSSLLTNANVEHVAVSTLSERSRSTSISRNTLTTFFDRKLSQTLDDTFCAPNKYNTIGKSIEANEFNEFCEEKDKKQFQIIASLDYDSAQKSSNVLRDRKYENKIELGTVLNNAEVKRDNSFSKITICNEVLQNPWRSRLTYTFSPFPRKVYDSFVQLSSDDIVTTSKSDILLLNEGNNITNTTVTKTIKTKERESEKKIDSNILKCNICKQIFTDKDSLSSHMKKQHSSRYTCVECDKNFSQLRNFKYHMSVHRGSKEFATTCPVCGKYFNDKGYLSSHMKIHRNRKEYKCSLCPKSFNQRVAYNMHIRIHTGVKPHVCDECDKAFSRKMLLKQHQRTHSGERPYACSYCDKRFADRSNMTLHLRLHTGVKPFNCTLCSKSFTKKHHLKSHLNFHTGDKPYSCPRCDLAFTQSSNMRTHYKKCAQSANDYSR